jgi:hypothetical protein
MSLRQLTDDKPREHWRQQVSCKSDGEQSARNLREKGRGTSDPSLRHEEQDTGKGEKTGRHNEQPNGNPSELVWTKAFVHGCKRPYSPNLKGTRVFRNCWLSPVFKQSLTRFSLFCARFPQGEFLL